MSQPIFESGAACIHEISSTFYYIKLANSNCVRADIELLGNGWADGSISGQSERDRERGNIQTRARDRQRVGEGLSGAKSPIGPLLYIVLFPFVGVT